MRVHIAESAKSAKWKPYDVTWEAFVDQKLRRPIITGETFSVYKTLNKDEKSVYKDCGGYLFGSLLKDSRAKNNVISRNALLLDLDFAPIDVWDRIISTYNFEIVLHTTHSHESANPRFRIIVPLNRECTPDEYECTARAFAAYLNMAWFDKTTFQRNRLMYFPSRSQDGEWIFEWQRGEFLNVDEVLSTFSDWRDMTTWFYHPEEKSLHEGNGNTRQDPKEAAGVIGAFNRTFDIHQTIATFFPDLYKHEENDRYTYVKGSSAKGAVVYDDVWFYSYHATDPAEGRLLNSFELMACHCFNDDVKQAMQFAGNIPEIRKDMVLASFADLGEDVSVEEFDAEWYGQLELDKAGKVAATDRNVRLIFENDSNLKGVFRYNEFVRNIYLSRPTSWRKDIPEEGDQIRNIDYPCLRTYLGLKYELTNRAMIDETMQAIAYTNKYHPIREYLTSLQWDGEKRLETTMQDYFNAEDSAYTCEVFKRSMIGAVMRAMNAGCKHDTVMILVGAEGTAKSEFLRRLGGKWHSDTFDMSHGKEVFEQLQGKWIIEIAEFDKMSRVEVGQVKYFITKSADTYRPAYGHVPEDYPRQCIFFGSTNEDNFLKSETGNRRFYPIQVRNGMMEKNLCSSKKYVFNDLNQYEVDQIFAEAYKLYLDGETNVISKKAMSEVDKVHENYEEQSVLVGEIDMMLETLVPSNYYDLSPEQAAGWWRFPELRKDKDLVPLEYVTPIQLWVEILGRSRESYGRIQQLEILSAIRKSRMLDSNGILIRTKRYGSQKAYKLKTNTQQNDEN